MNEWRKICVDCGVYLDCKRNGVIVYKENDYIFHADLWECPVCGYQIVADFGAEPILWWYEDKDKFEEIIREAKLAYKIEK